MLYDNHVMIEDFLNEVLGIFKDRLDLTYDKIVPYAHLCDQALECLKVLKEMEPRVIKEDCLNMVIHNLRSTVVAASDAILDLENFARAQSSYKEILTGIQTLGLNSLDLILNQPTVASPTDAETSAG